MCSMTLCWTKFKNRCFFCSGKNIAFDSLSCQISTLLLTVQPPSKAGRKTNAGVDQCSIPCIQSESNFYIRRFDRSLLDTICLQISNFTKEDTELPWEVLNMTIFSSRTIIIIIEIICCNHENNILWLFPERNNCSIVFQ